LQKLFQYGASSTGVVTMRKTATNPQYIYIYIYIYRERERERERER